MSLTFLVTHARGSNPALPRAVRASDHCATAASPALRSRGEWEGGKAEVADSAPLLFRARK